MLKSIKKIIPPDDIINLNDAIIGKDEIDPNYPYLIMKLDNKIKDRTFAKDYYAAYRNALTGKSYLESNKQKLDYPFCSKEISEMLKNILSFICLLDLDPLLLNSFYAAILYYAVFHLQIHLHTLNYHYYHILFLFHFFYHLNIHLHILNCH